MWVASRATQALLASQVAFFWEPAAMGITAGVAFDPVQEGGNLTGRRQVKGSESIGQVKAA